MYGVSITRGFVGEIQEKRGEKTFKESTESYLTEKWTYVHLSREMNVT